MIRIIDKAKRIWGNLPGKRKFKDKLRSIFKKFNLRDFIKNYGKQRVARELRKFTNLYIAIAILQRLFILSVIWIIYIFAKELHANIKLYVAIITLLIGFYTGVKVVIGSCFYIYYCAQEGWSFHPLKIAKRYAASEICKELEHNKWAVRLILRLIVGRTDTFAYELAHLALQDREILRLIRIQLLYYLIIFLLYMFGYNFIYEKLIEIDFNNFLHPFIWSWCYLVNYPI